MRTLGRRAGCLAKHMPSLLAGKSCSLGQSPLSSKLEAQRQPCLTYLCRGATGFQGSLRLSQFQDDSTAPGMPHSGKQCRRKLNLNFAVLLMRSTYEAVDALDFVAMDKFQVAFWKLRQSQFEVYKNSLDPVPVPVGDLSASSYFDFIAFAQYATISNIIPDAPQMFEEYCESCEGDPFERPNRVVRRDAFLADNKKLPKQLQLEVGRKVYQKLREGFRDEQFNCPAPLASTASAAELQSRLQSMLKVFTDNGFAIRADISDMQQQGQEYMWQVRMEGSANLWGLQALRARRSLVTDSFDTFCVSAFLDASGFDSNVEVDANSAYADQFWTARPRRLTA